MIDLPEKTEEFIRLAKGISLLEAALSPEWEFRYFSFNPKWSPSEMMASMRDGAGNRWFALIAESNIAITGSLVDEAGVTQVFEELPDIFKENLANEPAFLTQECCFCFWKLKSQSRWTYRFSSDKIQQAVADLFTVFSPDPKRYVAFVKLYYEKHVSVDLVKKAFRNERITIEEIRKANSEIESRLWDTEIEELEYGKST